MTSFSVALHEYTKTLFGQLNCLVKLADISTRCSSHSQGKSEARCEKGGALIGVATVLAHAHAAGCKGWSAGAVAPPPSFFIIAIQQPGSS